MVVLVVQGLGELNAARRVLCILLTHEYVIRRTLVIYTNWVVTVVDGLTASRRVVAALPSTCLLCALLMASTRGYSPPKLGVRPKLLLPSLSFLYNSIDNYTYETILYLQPSSG